MSVFDHFVKLALKGLVFEIKGVVQGQISVSDDMHDDSMTQKIYGQKSLHMSCPMTGKSI